MPGGKNEHDENITTTASRELREEAGIDADPAEAVGSLCFISSRGLKSQEIFFIMRVKGTLKVRLNETECQDYTWATLKEAKRKGLTARNLTYPLLEKAFQMQKAGLSVARIPEYGPPMYR